MLGKNLIALVLAFAAFRAGAAPAPSSSLLIRVTPSMADSSVELKRSFYAPCPINSSTTFGASYSVEGETDYVVVVRCAIKPGFGIPGRFVEALVGSYKSGEEAASIASAMITSGKQFSCGVGGNFGINPTGNANLWCSDL